MTDTHPQRVVVVAGHPAHATLAQFPAVCFTLTLLTDLAYWRTSNLLWQHFSEWLLLAGLVVGVVAAVVGGISFLLHSRRYGLEPAWPYLIGTVLVLILAFINSLVHSGDGWTAVVPTGLILSAVTVLALAITGWIGWSSAYNHAGVTRYD